MYIARIEYHVKKQDIWRSEINDLFSFWKNISITVAYLLFFKAFKNQSFIIKWYSILDDTPKYKKNIAQYLLTWKIDV